MIINIDEINTDNILYYKPDNLLSINNEIGIYYYYKDNEIKILFQTSPIIINKLNKYSLELFLKSNVRINNDKDIKKLKTFIKKIDKINETIIENNKSRWKIPNSLKYQSSLSQIDNLTVEIPYDSESGYHLQIYDFDDKDITIDQLKNNDHIICVIELSHLFFTNNGYGTKWIVHQIQKVYPVSPIQRAINKQKIIKLDIYQFKQSVEIQIKPIVNNNSTSSFSIPPPPPPPKPPTNNSLKPQLFCPTVNDLQSIMSTLKKPPIKIQPLDKTIIESLSKIDNNKSEEDEIIKVKEKKKKKKKDTEFE